MNQFQVKDYFDYLDGELYWKVAKGHICVGQKAGSKRVDGYKSIKIDKKGYLAHRLIFLWHHGYLPKELDHINGNPSDNRIENLRPATRAQNMYNIGIASNATSKNKCVVWHKATKKWEVRLSDNGIRRYFGVYKDIDYAIFIADAMRYKYHKEFANKG
jgi:hypothetical protein